MDDARSITTTVPSIRPKDPAEKAINDHEILDELRTALTCTVCTRTMSKPYILPACGHTFCFLCLRSWFEKELDEKGGSILTGAKQPLRKAYKILGFLMATERLLKRKALKCLCRPSRFPVPIYTCPSPDCKEYVVLPPTKDKTLTALAAASGFVDYKVSSAQAVEGRRPFGDLFPCVFTDKIPPSELEGLASLDENGVDGIIMQFFPDLVDSESDEEHEEERYNAESDEEDSKES